MDLVECECLGLIFSTFKTVHGDKFADIGLTSSRQNSQVEERKQPSIYRHSNPPPKSPISIYYSKRRPRQATLTIQSV